MNSTIVYKNGPDTELTGYITGDGGTVKREQGLTPNLNPISHRWVYRDANGVFVDVDAHRQDLFERNDLRGPL